MYVSCDDKSYETIEKDKKIESDWELFYTRYRNGSSEEYFNRNVNKVKQQ